jgi:hypothetical protein
MTWGGAVRCSAHLEGGEEARGGEGAPGRAAAGGAGERAGAPEVEDNPDKWAPPVSGAREGRGFGGLAR